MPTGTKRLKGYDTLDWVEKGLMMKYQRATRLMGRDSS